ncbi:MAG: NUDIX hydrolase [Thermoleophilia bacterium]
MAFEQPLLQWELDLIERVCGDDRHHDVTMFVRRGTALAVVRKPSDPLGVWWVPAGGVGAGEGLADAGRREAWEEAGVECRVTRYLLRLNVQFTCGDRQRPWTSHVIEAAWEGGDPHPVDTREVEAARWLSSRDFAREVVPEMRASGWGRFDYRLRMAAAVFVELGLPGRIGLPPPLQCSGR